MKTFSKIWFYALIICCIQGPALQMQAQNFKWLSPGVIGTVNSGDNYQAVATDAAGCVYTTGWLITKSGSFYNFTVTLNKYAPNGAALYKKDIDLYNATSDASEGGVDIAVSLADNRAIVGGNSFAGPFLGFFDATYGFLITQTSIPSNATISKIDFRNGAVWVIGNFSGTLSLGSGFTFTGTTIPNGGDIFVAKYNLSGALLAAMHIKGTGYLKGYDIKVDAGNNAYITASTEQTALFQVLSNTTYVPTSGKVEIFAAKLNPALNGVLWTQMLQITPAGTGSDGRYPIALYQTPQGADVFAVGGLIGTLVGSFLQVRHQSNAALFCQSATIPGKLIRDLVAPACSSLGIYVTGTTIASFCNGKVFVSKFDRNGCAQLWDRYSNVCAGAEGIATDAAGNVAIAGNYNTTAFKLGGLILKNPGGSGGFASLFRDNGACCTNRELTFDGTDDYLQANNAPWLANGNFTIEAWAYSIATGTAGCSTNFRRMLSWEGPGAAALEIGECSGLLTVYYNPGNTYLTVPGINIRGGWHHVAVSKTGNTLTVYLDGIPKVVKNNVILNLAGPFRIGRATGTANNGTETWRGRLDEVRVWNAARSQSAILNSKNCSVSWNAPNLIMYYPFDQGIPVGANANAGVAYDYTTTAAHASLYNFNLSGALSNWTCANSPVSNTCPFGPKIPQLAVAEPRIDSNPDDAEIQWAHIFPNPTTGDVTVELSQPTKPGTTFRITDITGRLTLDAKTETGSAKQTIQASNLPNGLYFLQVLEEGKVLAVEKFVKQ
ncbi:MAG: T9SS type A sorting domain-containing protein [Lewinellaceae bacterium]|nr:T9SS type A sorting domain-containing protein [Lewinellaceae bacterium]